jgi:hypothetical protein
MGELAAQDQYDQLARERAIRFRSNASNLSIPPGVSVDYPEPPMGALAAQDQYNPLPDVGAPLIPSGPQVSAGAPWANRLTERLPSAVMGGLAQQVATPGKLMAPNPYPEGSEEASWYDDQRAKAMTDWAPGTALNTIGTGAIVGVPVKGAETVLGAGGVRPKPPKMGDIVAPETYDFLTGARPDAPFPQYAYQYPDIGPPTMTPKKPGSEDVYPAKTLTPEAQAVEKARSKIIADMDKYGYQPFFDPSQRFPAEFSQQPGPHLDTATVLAKKQQTIDRHLATIDTPETRQALRDAYSRGLDLPDAQAWYLLGQVEKKMIEDMGEAAGREHFRNTFATSMSATTTGMNPQQNLIMGQYLNYLKATGQPFPTAAHMTPVAVGGQRTMPNIEAYQKIFDEGGYGALGPKNPKRADFAQAIMGNPNAFTVDEQMAHGMIGKDVPQEGTYGIITGIGREEAAAAGADPQRYQDVAWAGFKKKLEEATRAQRKFAPYGPGEGYQGKPLISEVNDMIERMHRLTGMPRQDVWRKVFIENSIPVYGIAGATAMGSLAAPYYAEPPATQ